MEPGLKDQVKLLKMSKIDNREQTDSVLATIKMCIRDSYTPLHSGNASAIVETPWVNVGYSVVGVGKRYYLSQNLPENEIEGYWAVSYTHLSD